MDVGNGGRKASRRVLRRTGGRLQSPTVEPLSFGIPSVPEQWDGDGLDDADGWPRENGTVAPDRPERYGQDWARIVFHANEVLQADPDYQFLFMVAGAANTSVESLYRSEEVSRAVQQMGEVATAATRASDVVRRIWSRYQFVARLVRSFNDEGGARHLTNLRESMLFTRAAAHQSQLLAAQATTAAYLQHSTSGGVIPRAADPAQVPTRGQFERAGRALAESTLWLVSDEAPARALQPVSPVVTIEHLGDRGARVAERMEELAKSVGDKAVSPATRFDRTFALATLDLSWRRVAPMPDTPGYLRLDPEGDVVVGEPGGEEGEEEDEDRPGWAAPPEPEPRTPRAVWLDWSEDALASETGAPIVQTESFIRLHQLASGASDDQLEAEAERGAAARTRAGEAYTRTLQLAREAADSLQEWVDAHVDPAGKVLDPETARVMEQVQQALRDTTAALGRGDADDPLAFLRLGLDRTVDQAVGGVMRSLRGINAREAQLRERIDRSVEEGIAPLVGGGGAATVRPDWALQARFTGHVSLTAPTVAAINNAYADVTRWLPGLVPPGVGGSVHRALKRTPVLAQLYADLVASHLLEASIRFPRQWQLEKSYPRAQAHRVGVLMRMSSWTWGDGSPIDTGEVGASSVGGFGGAPWSLESRRVQRRNLTPAIHPAAPPAPAPRPLGLAAVQARDGEAPQRRPLVGFSAARFDDGQPQRKKARREATDDERRERLVGIAAAWNARDIRRAVLDAARRRLSTGP